MARSKSGKVRRRTHIRQRQKRRMKRQKLAKKLGVSIDELLQMIKRGEVNVKSESKMVSQAL